MSLRLCVKGISGGFPSGSHFFWQSLIFLFASAVPLISAAQVQVYQESPFSFGAMILSEAGGTVTVTPAGDRSATGGIVLLSTTEFHPLILSVEAPYGSVIQIQFGTEQLLYGENGGQIGLTLNASDPISPFTSLATPPQRTTVYIGGTLSLGPRSTTPTGVYSGSITVTFIQE
jgi:hypothetical protein